MKTAEELIFVDVTYPAGTPCELANDIERTSILQNRSAVTQLMVKSGHMRVIRIGGKLYIVASDAVEE